MVQETGLPWVSKTHVKSVMHDIEQTLHEKQMVSHLTFLLTSGCNC